MKTAMFVDEDARAKIARWYDEFRAALPFSTEARLLETSFGKTHLLMTGPEDGPPLVVLHGALASSAHILRELGSLVKTHRIYAIDVLGQSVMSADRRMDLDDDSYGKWLVEVVDALALETFALFGVSWGGFVATRLVRVAAVRIRALVLMVPAGFVAGSAWRGFVEVGWPLMTYRLFPNDTRLRRLVDAMFTSFDERWAKYVGDAFRCYRLDMRVPPLLRAEDVAAFEGPVLVMAGDRDVSFPGDALVTRAKELFANAETHLIADCKHCPSFEEPAREAVAARIAKVV